MKVREARSNHDEHKPAPAAPVTSPADAQGPHFAQRATMQSRIDRSPRVVAQSLAIDALRRNGAQGPHFPHHATMQSRIARSPRVVAQSVAIDALRQNGAQGSGGSPARETATDRCGIHGDRVAPSVGLPTQLRTGLGPGVVQRLAKLVKEQPEIWYDKQDGKYWQMQYKGSVSNSWMIEQKNNGLNDVRGFNSRSRHHISIELNEMDEAHFKVHNKGASQPFLVQISDVAFVDESTNRTIAEKSREATGVRSAKLYAEGSFDHAKHLHKRLISGNTKEFVSGSTPVIPRDFDKDNSTIKATEYLSLDEATVPSGLEGSLEVQHGFGQHNSVDMARPRNHSLRMYNLIQATFPYPGGRQSKYKLPYDNTGFKSLIVEFIEVSLGKLAPGGQIRLVISECTPTKHFVNELQLGFKQLKFNFEYVNKYSNAFQGDFKHLKTNSTEEVSFPGFERDLIITVQT